MKGKYLLLGCIMLAACTQKSPVKPDENAPLGVQQAWELWTEEDGSRAEFEQLVSDYYCQTDSQRQMLFESLSRILENVYQSADMLTVELLRPTQLTNAAGHAGNGLMRVWEMCLRLVCPVR